MTGGEFAVLLDALGPLEPNPAIAVAVSGGADSLALAHLARETIRDRGGRLHALTVDHGLRPGSADEADQVARWMAGLDIPHSILRWAEATRSGNLQARARRARYELLDRWCRAHGVLHLVTAHHADDQAETRVLRLARRAGLGGLAGMSAVEALGSCQLLRPLLPVPRARLEATLIDRGQTWLDDPSNTDRRFDRVRVRDSQRDRAPPNDGRHFGDVRAREETAVAALLARAVAVAPSGAARLRRHPFQTADRVLAARALGAVLATVGGTLYPPRHDSLRSAVGAWLAADESGARTLGGCRLAPALDGSLAVTREAGRIAHRVDLPPGARVLWDGRFRLLAEPAAQGLSAARLTDAHWREMTRALPWLGGVGLTHAIRSALPAVHREGRVVGLPFAGAWLPEPWTTPDGPAPGPVSAHFAPNRALTRAAFVGAAELVCGPESVV